MEFKGTKGKWKRVKLSATQFYSERNEIQYGGDGECVAEFISNDYDALLISKAPEMFEMLNKVLEYSFENLPHLRPQIQQLIKEATEL